jgi:ABC-type hemin transport system substrate-binding protein
VNSITLWYACGVEERQLSGVALRRVSTRRPYQHAVDEARWRALEEGVQDDCPEFTKHWQTARTWLRSPVTGTLVLYAQRAGQTALDGTGEGADSPLATVGGSPAAATMANQTVPMNSDSSVRARVQVALRRALRNIVQAAAENTNTFATMTGDALINTPYSTQSAAPNI